MPTYVMRQGGLGNQLFQLAAAAALDPDGDGRLLPAEQRSVFDIEDFAPCLIPQFTDRDRERIDAILPALTFHQELHDNLGAAFVPRPHFERRPQLLIGYFQHPDWYAAAVPRIVDELLALAPAGLAPAADGQPAVSVRGGDYGPLGWLVPPAYYVAAAKKARLHGARMVADDPDRASVVAEALATAGRPTEPMRAGTRPIDDFWALAAAPTVLMSNSSFCWWAVRVGDEWYRRAGLRRTVIFPAQWLVGHGGHLREPSWRAVTSHDRDGGWFGRRRPHPG